MDVKRMLERFGREIMPHYLDAQRDIGATSVRA